MWRTPLTDINKSTLQHYNDDVLRNVSALVGEVNATTIHNLIIGDTVHRFNYVTDFSMTFTHIHNVSYRLSLFFGAIYYRDAVVLEFENANFISECGTVAPRWEELYNSPTSWINRANLDYINITNINISTLIMFKLADISEG